MKLLSALFATLVAHLLMVSPLIGQSPGGVGTADLQIWLRSDKGLGSIGNGDPVSLWEDQGVLGNDATQALGLAQPIYKSKEINGHPALHFNLNNRFMEANLSGIQNGEYTIFIVSKRTSGGANSYMLGIDQSTPTAGFSLGYATPNTLEVSQFGGTTSLSISPHSPSTDTPSIISVNKSSLGGLFAEQVLEGTNNNASSPFTTGTDSGIGLIGRGSSGQGFRGAIAEVIVYRRSLSAAETKEIKTYLAIKYGLTIEVNDHLYFSDAIYNNGTISLGKLTDSNLTQESSSSESNGSILSISHAQNLGTGDIITIGHNGGPTAFGGGSLNCAVARVLRRNWKVEEVGDVGEVRLEFETSGMGFIDPNETVLIVDRNNNGFHDDVIIHGEMFGSTLRFKNIDLKDGNRFTLGLGRTRFFAAIDGNSSDPIWSTDGSTSGMRSINFCEFTEYIIPAGRNVVIDHPTAIVGSMIVDGNLDLNGVNLELKQNLEVQGNLTSNGAMIIFSGGQDQYIEGTGSTIEVDDLSLLSSENLFVRCNELAVHGIVYVENGTLRTNDKLRLVSDASGTGMISTLNGDLIGQITAERFHPASNNGYVMLGTPIQNMSNADLNSDLVTTGFTGADYESYPFNNIRSYDESEVGDRNQGFQGATGLGDAFDVGSGRLIYMSSGSQHLTLEGSVQKGNINLPVSYTNHGTPAEDGWNLVANPYPCTIDWTDLNWSKANLDDAIYVYDAATGSYASYVNGIGNNGGSNLIAPFQAFWVHANGPSPQLTATENVKAPLAGDFKNNDSTPFHLFVSQENQQDEVSFYWNENATNAFDAQLEAEKMMISEDLLSVAAIQGEGQLLSIHALATENGALQIPLSVTIPAEGQIVFTSEGMEDTMNGRCVVLTDSETGVSQPIMSGDEVVLNLAPGNYGQRFYLEVSASIISDVIHPTCPESNNGSISALNPMEGNAAWYNDANELISNESTIQQLSEGIYRYELDGAGACGQLVAHLVLSAPDPIVLENTLVMPSCPNSADGLISTNISGGAAPFNMLWSNASTGNSIDGLLPGEYQLNITDANACETTASFILNSEMPLEANFEAPEWVELVAGMAVVPFVNNSNEASSYLWSFGEGSFSTEMNPNHVFNEIGSYEVTLTVSNGACSTSSSKTIVVDSAQGLDMEGFADEFNVGFTQDGIFVQHQLGNFNGTINVYNMLGQKLIPSTAFQNEIILQVPVYNNYVLIDIYSQETGQRTFIKRIR